MVEAASIRLVTWNCNQAFRRKQHQLLDLEPDVAVVPECEHPEEKGDWSAWADWELTGDDPHKGLGVFTWGSIDITNTTEIAEADHFLHIETDAVDVLAVWAILRPHEGSSVTGRTWPLQASFPRFDLTRVRL